MYKISFYKNLQGEQPVLDYMRNLAGQSGKDARLNLTKIKAYIDVLAKKGFSAGQPFIKHLRGEIWELRPLRNRIFFVAWHNDRFVLLHHFLKTTQKTPGKELKKAEQELADLKARGV